MSLAAEPGPLTLPSGRRLHGRSLRRPPPTNPDWGLYLSARRAPDPGWPSRWVRWRDFWVPTDAADARDALTEAWRRCATQQVEIACLGGVGRTGTALAGIAVLDGMDVDDAIDFVRAHYHRRAVETPWQRAWLRRELVY